MKRKLILTIGLLAVATVLLAAWDPKNEATLTTISTTEQFFSNIVQPNPGETCHHQLTCTFDASPTVNCIVSFYATLDDTTEEWDITPFVQVELASAPNPNRRSQAVSSLYRYRVGVKSTGAQDVTSAKHAYRCDGINVQ